MSTLTEALDRIFIQLQRKGRLTPSFLPPGLTRAEIDALIKDLPLRLPQEVYDLYQWSRGFNINSVYETLLTHPGQGAYFFDGYALIALQDVIEIYREKLKDSKYYYECNMERYNRTWIQIFVCYLSEFEGYILTENNSKNCGVVFANYKDIDNERKQQYVSLTTMMQTLSEWYEQDYSGIDGSPKNFDEIWRKYNSSLVDAVLVELTDKISYESLLKIEQDLMKFKDSRSVGPDN